MCFPDTHAQYHLAEWCTKPGKREMRKWVSPFLQEFQAPLGVSHLVSELSMNQFTLILNQLLAIILAIIFLLPYTVQLWLCQSKYLSKAQPLWYPLFISPDDSWAKTVRIQRPKKKRKEKGRKDAPVNCTPRRNRCSRISQCPRCLP